MTKTEVLEALKRLSLKLPCDQVVDNDRDAGGQVKFIYGRNYQDIVDISTIRSFIEAAPESAQELKRSLIEAERPQI